MNLKDQGVIFIDDSQPHFFDEMRETAENPIILEDDEECLYIPSRNSLVQEVTNQLYTITKKDSVAIKRIVQELIDQFDNEHQLEVDMVTELCMDAVLCLPDCEINALSSSSSSSSSRVPRPNISSSSSSRDENNEKRQVYVVDDVAAQVTNVEVSSRLTISSSSSSSHSNHSVKPSPLQQLLMIFPTAKVSYASRILQQHDNNIQVVADLFFQKGYEKEEKISNTSSSSTDIDFMKTSSFVPTVDYKDQALLLLQNHFPFISLVSLREFFTFNPDVLGHYAIAYEILSKTLGVIPRDGFSLSPLPKDFNPLVSQESLDKLKLKSKNPRKYPCMIFKSAIDKILLQEVEFIQKKYLQLMEQSDYEAAKKLNEDIANEEGSMFECGCCYSEYPFEDFVQCSEGHLFCRECLKRYIETTVFSDGRSQINCMNTGSDACDGYFPESMIQFALPEKVYTKFQEAIARDAVKLAHIENLIACVACDYKVELAADAGFIMHCPSCGKDTCSLCKEESHIPLKCSEVEKKSQTNARLTLEEAMTEARVRVCHKCRTRFYKTEGCNKMTCSCGAHICYICRQDITKIGYAHFCQTFQCSHQNCKKCSLYSNSIEDDKLAMYDAGVKALEETKESNELNQNGVNQLAQLEKLIEGGKVPIRGAKPQLATAGIAQRAPVMPLMMPVLARIAPPVRRAPPDDLRLRRIVVKRQRR